MKYARMTDNTAVEVVSPEAWATFNGAVQALFIEVPDHIERGWTMDGGEWSAPEPEPAPEPQPQPLTLLEFKLLVLTVAGLTPEQFMAARDDTTPAVRLAWEFLGSASQVERDFPTTQQGLGTLVAAGHLTEGQVDAINAAWPTE